METRDPQRPDANQQPTGTTEHVSATRRWAETVRFSGSGGGFAYRPGELVIDASAVPQLVELTGREDFTILPIGPALVLVTGVPGELGIAAALRARGRRAQPNHILFAAVEAHAASTSSFALASLGAVPLCATLLPKPR